MKNIIVLVSGGGTNLQALLEAEQAGAFPGGSITCVISSRGDAYALRRAEQFHVKSRVIAKKDYPDFSAYTDAMLLALKEEQADLIVLAGFLTILDERIIAAYPNRIINVHPSLIPAFCGEGFYGLRVHECALKRGVKYCRRWADYFTKAGCSGRGRYAADPAKANHGRSRVEVAAGSRSVVLCRQAGSA